MIQSKGYAAQSSTSPLTPFSFERRDPGPKDVVVEIAYSGICHSDIHQVRDEWGGSMYPMVPGHEIVGKVTAIGPEVKKFKVGDLAAVGVTVETCMQCENCLAGAEPYCQKGMVGTYNAKTYDGDVTFGGYANNIVAPEHYVYSKSRLNLILPPRRRCSAPALPPGRRSSTGRLGPARRSESSASAVSGTWRSNSPTRSAPM